MKNKSIKKVVEDLTAIFLINEKNEFVSTMNNNKFHIDKRQFGRYDVIAKLHLYFKNTIINGGYLKLDNITFATTTFEVLEGKPN